MRSCLNRDWLVPRVVTSVQGRGLWLCTSRRRARRVPRGARSFSYKSGSSRALQEGGVRSGQATRRPGDSRANSASLQVEKAPDALP